MRPKTYSRGIKQETNQAFLPQNSI